MKIDDTKVVTVFFNSGRIECYRIDKDYSKDGNFRNQYAYISNIGGSNRIIELKHYYSFEDKDNLESD